MIKPNLPDAPVRKAICSAEIPEEIRKSLHSFGISAIKLSGLMNCDNAVKNHTDLYTVHISDNLLLYAKNTCSIEGELPKEFKGITVDITDGNKILYPDDVFFNCVVIGKDLICCEKYIHKSVSELSEQYGYNIINVNQGYTKCNICVVDENSIITEDFGIASALSKHNYDVLLLKEHCVKLTGYKYGFIGGASGKISKDKLAFFGNIEKHTEFGEISRFLLGKGVKPVSLSDGDITDYGSLIPVE